jgi:hypothetical protein
MATVTDIKCEWRPLIFSILSGCAATLIIFIGIVYAAVRVDGAYSQQNSGDFAVWITVHEFLKRGHMLYRDIWDHKDPGFFFLSHPLFEAYSVRGLYIFGLLMTVCLTLGIFLCTFKLIGAIGAAALAAGATIFYSGLPSFWSTYTETYSVGLCVLGLALITSAPMLAGVIIALSCTMKLSVVIIVAIVVGAALIRRPFTSTSLTSLWRLIAGYAFGLAAFGLYFWREVDIQGWLQVVAFNREYAARRSPPYDWGMWRSLFFSAPIMIQQLFMLVAVAIPLSSLLKLIFQRKQEQTLLIPPALLALTSAVGGLCVMMLQYPPSPHHWQFLAGMAVFSASIGIASFIHQIPHRYLRLSMVVALAVPVFAHSQPALHLARHGGWRNFYRVAEQHAQLRDFIKGLPNQMSFAIYGLNDSRIDFSEAPRSLRLACRFFFQGGMLSPTFYEEIISCLDRAPDVVFLNKTPQTPAFTKGLERVKAEYTLCPPRPCNYEIYGRTQQICETLPGHESIKS